jgi:FixJ family two-component response regulator
MESPGKEVLIVDDDLDLRHALADLVEAVNGRRVIGVADLDELVALGPRALACGLVIIDVNLGPGVPSGLDALAWLQKQGYRGNMVFLTGHGRSDPQVQEAQRLGGIPVLTKPLGVEAILSLIERTL